MKKTIRLLVSLALALMLALGLASCYESIDGGDAEFKIIFMSEGEVHATVQAGDGEAIEMPQNPTKDNAVFLGWYLDEDSYDRPFSAEYLIDTPLTSDITVYAGWYAEEVTIITSAFTINGRNLSATVCAAAEEFRFALDITVTGGASWVVSLDEEGDEIVESKIITLVDGANRCYIHVTSPDRSVETYTVDIYRNHIYTVSFDTLGGSYAEPQYIEEGYYASEPEVERAGYELVGWDFDFATPIIGNITVSADWSPRTDIPYKVEYYLENLDGSYPEAPNYFVELSGTTEETKTAEIKSFEHFIFKEQGSVTSGIIDGLGTLVLRVYYTREAYTASVAADNERAGSVSGGGSYKYGEKITVSATTNPGYTFLGWYEGTELVSSSAVYAFEAEKAVSYTAKWEAGETTYTVNHYKSTFTKNGYVNELIQSETISAKTGDIVEAEERNISDLIFSEAHSVKRGEAQGDGSLVLCMYYISGAQYIREENYIYFGEYPQSVKAEGVSVTDLIDGRGYYLGSDGFYYAKVTADPYSLSYTFSTGATVSSGSVYYFKVEPIRWRILSESHESALILCDSIIANKAYDFSSNNYKDSDIRAWLNEQFYKTAFSELQRELIITTTVDNSVQSTGYSSNPYVCENTEDKIFLLSYSEVTNAGYGFASSYSTYDTARRMLTSDYSRATGAWMSTSSSYYGNGYWWPRSPYSDYRGRARSVGYDGYAGYSDYVSLDYHGVVPALQIRL